MSLADWASWLGIVNGVAVVVSLLYLAVQTRQNARHTMALIHQGCANQATSRMAQIASDPPLAAVLLRAAAGDPELSDRKCCNSPSC